MSDGKLDWKAEAEASFGVGTIDDDVAAMDHFHDTGQVARRVIGRGQDAREETDQEMRDRIRRYQSHRRPE